MFFQPFYIQMAALAFYYYDFALTFAAEVAHVWPQPISMNTFLFFSNRYVSFSGNIVVFILLFTPLLIRSCSSIVLIREILLVLGQVIVSATLATRTVALYGRSRVVTIVVMGFGFLIAGVTCWTLVAGHASTDSQYMPGAHGCRNLLPEQSAIHLAVAWEASALFDVFIFALTVTKTLKMRKVHNTTNGSKAGLLDLILRDGALYFFVMAIANSANIFSYYFATSANKSTFTTPAGCVASTLCSRLVLNLYDVATQDGTTDSDYSSEPMTGGIFTTRIELGFQMDQDHDGRNEVKSGWR
ncbi:hypothetical protein BGY98DRAFT_523966 [Russula aff. rugulosa BPL654]|nr:hypothetical protein BGY98DRAFT_523966 [Russula aff. rugulosa BPL654]